MSQTISLRKSNAIQLAIIDLLKTIPITPTVVISVFQDPSETIAVSHEKFYKNYIRYLKLISALEEIRISTGKANVEFGIQESLTMTASVDRLISHYTTILSSEVRLSDSVIIGKLSKLTEPSQHDYYRQDTLAIGLFTEEQMIEFSDKLKILKKNKQVMKDSVLELNIKHSITLSDATYSLLTDEQLI